MRIAQSGFVVAMKNQEICPAPVGPARPLLPALLRTLLLARLLWGNRARLSLLELSRSLRVSEAELRRTLYLLYRSRWLWFDAGSLAVRLTDEGEAYFMNAECGS